MRMRLLHIDIETRPRRKLCLKTVGVDIYAPECEILLFGWTYNNGGHIHCGLAKARVGRPI